jgi:peptidoglycan/LPS O-acetylase OafA/YrhL
MAVTAAPIPAAATVGARSSATFRNPRFPLMDSVRAVAVLLVVLSHTAGMTGQDGDPVTGWLTYYGFIGVDIFFVVSGFLLYRPYAAAHAGLAPTPRLREFGRRRALRILPAYWFALAAMTVWPGIAGAFGGDWWRYWGFTQSYTLNTALGGIPVGWSLCVEVTFYMALPLFAAVVALVMARTMPSSWWRAEAVALVVFASVGLAVLPMADIGMIPPLLRISLLGTTAYFAAGMALAVLSVALQRRGERPATWRLPISGGLAWLGAALAVVAANRVFDVWAIVDGAVSPPPITAAMVLGNQVLLAVASILIVAPAVFGSGGWVRRLLAARWLTLVGVVSYGIYLWHYPVAAWLAGYHYAPDPIPGTTGGPRVNLWFGDGAQTPKLFVATVLVTTAIAALSYRFVELPFLRRKPRPAADPEAVRVGLVGRP